MNKYYINLAKPCIQKLKPYLPGKPIAETAREQNFEPENIVKLASNENPLGCSPKVKRQLIDSINDLELYPDANGTLAKKALSRHLNVPVNQITLGCGSDELLRLIALCYAGVGGEIIYSEYAFVVYSIATSMVGATSIEIPAKKWGHDLESMADAVTDKTRIIYIANPNNPTGTWVEQDQLQQFLKKIPPHVIVVLDEAYIEYFENIDIHDSLHWMTQYPNLVITRTFSKAYGLASLRIGYLIAHPDISDVINRVRPAFNMSTIAQNALITALQDQPFIEKSRRINHQGLEYLQKEFHRMEIDYIPSRGNFITINTERMGGSGQQIFEKLLKVGFIIRPLAGYNMKNYVRISVGKLEDNEKLISELVKLR